MILWITADRDPVVFARDMYAHLRTLDAALHKEHQEVKALRAEHEELEDMRFRMAGLEK